MEIVVVVVVTLAGWLALAVVVALAAERICAARDVRRRRPFGSSRGRRRR